MPITTDRAIVKNKNVLKELDLVMKSLFSQKGLQKETCLTAFRWELMSEWWCSVDYVRAILSAALRRESRYLCALETELTNRISWVRVRHRLMAYDWIFFLNVSNTHANFIFACVGVSRNLTRSRCWSHVALAGQNECLQTSPRHSTSMEVYMLKINMSGPIRC